MRSPLADEIVPRSLKNLMLHDATQDPTRRRPRKTLLLRRAS